MRGKQKYVGGKTKIEAVLKLSKVRLLSTVTTQQVNDYITENFFNKPIWTDYYKIFQNVSNEFEIVNEKYELQYTLIAEFKKAIENPNDKRLIYLLTSELMEQKLTQFKGYKNPIVSLNKDQQNAN